MFGKPCLYQSSQFYDHLLKTFKINSNTTLPEIKVALKDMEKMLPHRILLSEIQKETSFRFEFPEADFIPSSLFSTKLKLTAKFESYDSSFWSRDTENRNYIFKMMVSTFEREYFRVHVCQETKYLGEIKIQHMYQNGKNPMIRVLKGNDYRDLVLKQNSDLYCFNGLLDILYELF